MQGFRPGSRNGHAVSRQGQVDEKCVKSTVSIEAYMMERKFTYSKLEYWTKEKHTVFVVLVFLRKVIHHRQLITIKSSSSSTAIIVVT